MQKVAIRVAQIIFSVVLLVYVGFQIFAYFYSPLKYETVVNYTVVDSIMAEGIIVRDEVPVIAENSGLRSYKIKNGEKVRTGTQLAYIYSSEDDVVSQLKIDVMQKELDMLLEAKESISASFGYTDIINKQITDKIGEAVDSFHFHHNLDTIDIRNDLTMLLNKRQLSIGKAEDFTPRITELKSQIDILKGKMASPTQIISAKQTGYFVEKADGYETHYNSSNIAELTVNDIKKMIENDIEPSFNKEQTVGKIITGLDWFFAVPISEANSRRFKTGQALTISFPFEKTKAIPATVEKVLKNSENEYIALFRCSYMSEELAAVRSQTVNINLKNISGLRINNKAIRFEKDVKGVYVKDGKNIKFKKIETVYTGDDFSLCKITDEKDSLKLYDEIIIEGTDLYDGKTIK